MNAWPWGSGPAPALRCDECRKRIGKGRAHFVTASGNLLCGRCMVPTIFGASTHSLHAKHYPDCPETWHDMFDHRNRIATRAAAWIVLDDPEKRLCA